MGTEKQVPKGVPEENEYHSLHWAVLLTYAVVLRRNIYAVVL